MRGLVPGLVTPHPLGQTLPGLFLDDGLVQRMCAGLDEVLAPVLATLDSLPAYLDPRTAPLDLLEWLGEWVGVALDGAHEPDRRRAVVGAAVELHRLRGTAAGVRRAVAVVFGGEPEVWESGAASWSTDPAAPLPGADPQALLVRLRVPDPAAVDVRRLEALVAAVKPAHVTHAVEVLRG